MKRITLSIVLLVCGFALTSTRAFAQASETPTSPNWFIGKVNLVLIGRDDVVSSKFQEYGEVPKGDSMPSFTLQARQSGNDFALFGQNISRTDQRYTGWARTSWIRVGFDYNQIPHNMGNHGHTIESETAPGVWSMSSSLRATFGAAVDARVPTSTRTYPFYADLFASAISSANIVDLKGLRQRGSVEIDLGEKLTFDLKLNYIRDLKTGYRGIGGGVIYSNVNSIVELPESLNEVTQDLGLRAAVNRSWGNVYATFAHNWYNNRQETTVFDNPLRPFDQVYTAASGSTPALGGPASGRIIGPPDNSADTASFGMMLKFRKQTRITADVGLGRWVQNAQIYPYTINSAILTPSGVRADSLAALDRQSLDGKIRTTTLNFGFTSRPIAKLGVRMRYRSYDLDNQTPTFVRTGSVGNAPDRSWTTLSAANYAENPLGWATASPYGSKTGRFDAQASYDIGDLTVEGAFRNSQIDRTYREATKGAETGGSVAAILHSSDSIRFRGTFDKSRRTASGYDATKSIGLQADESERESTRAGLDLEIAPGPWTFVLAYSRRNDDYPNRPNRVAGVSNTSNGLIKAKYDTYTGEVDWTPGDRANLGVFYTYENNLSTTRYGRDLITNILTFDGSDKTHTFGVNGHVVMVPDKWAVDFNARRQKLDGLMAITGDPLGSFALARAAYGGIQDITDYNDTTVTTINAQVDYTLSKSWIVSGGALYEKYVFADAYSIFGDQSNAGQFDPGNEMFPATGGFYLKANDGNYSVPVFYTKLSYRW